MTRSAERGRHHPIPRPLGRFRHVAAGIAKVFDTRAGTFGAQETAASLPRLFRL